MKKTYIFTEIIGCGKIGKIALNSFHKHHDLLVHIYGTKEDFSHIDKHRNNILIEVDKEILNKFDLGHWGTAFLWEKIIKTSKEDFLLHFDSDVIFRENIIDEMFKKAEEGFDLIGPRRNYHNNKNNRNDVRFVIDLCQTHIILFNRKKISKKYLTTYTINDYFKDLFNINLIKIVRNILWNTKQFASKNFFISKLCKMIHGTYTPFSFPNIDFFDPVMIDMINNGGRIFYLSSKETGTHNFYGTHNSLVPNLDFGTKIIHFSGVGSGLNFLNKKDKIKTVSKSYKKHCIDRYKLFCNIFYNTHKNDIELQDNYTDILNIKDWY